EPRFEGRSLVPLLRGAAPPADILAELWQSGEHGPPRRHALAFVHGATKLLVPPDPAREAPIAFDIVRDPLETEPGAVAGGLLDILRGREATLAARAASAAETVAVNAATRERLRALGYAD